MVLLSNPKGVMQGPIQSSVQWRKKKGIDMHIYTAAYM